MKDVLVRVAQSQAEGGCTMKGHINQHGEYDHRVVVIIDADGWLTRLCKPHAKSLLEQLRAVL